jgi:hypothetical protein
MKKTALLAALLVTIFSATAYTGYTGPENQPHIMGATGSSSASQSVSQNGTGWSTTFSEHSAGSSNTSTGVLNHSFENNTVEFEGAVQTPTPCYSLNAEVEDEENSYLFNVTSKETEKQEVCPQVISYRKYNATFQADEPFKLEVVHNGESVANMTHPDYEEKSNEEKKSGGALSALFSFFRSLF